MAKIHIRLFYICTLGFISMFTQAQDSSEDAFFIKRIFNETFQHGQAYEWLESIATEIGPRLSGSPQATAAVEYTYQILDTLGVSRVEKQEVMVPHWVRGPAEEVRIVNSKIIGTQSLASLALGNSIGTGKEGLVGEVVEVQSLDEVTQIGKKGIEGKIVFFNRPLDVTRIRTFHAYGGAVDQRGSGASRAAEFGAIAVVVRSMTTALDHVPHTGSLTYQEGKPQIPAVAISTLDADLLASVVRKEPTNVYIRTECRMLKPKQSYNVIGEIIGSTYPDEIILFGGHLDSWDVGHGAHDDGTGCVQAMEVLRILNQMNYRPKRTIRCVLFMNEENGLAGATTYAKVSNKKEEFHLAAIESDGGGFAPRGFRMQADASVFENYASQISQWDYLLEPYDLVFKHGGSGADIRPLMSQKGILIGLETDSQRYFDYHHSHEDTLDKVNRRELLYGAGAMTSLVYLIDRYGLSR